MFSDLEKKSTYKKVSYTYRIENISMCKKKYCVMYRKGKHVNQVYNIVRKIGGITTLQTKNIKPTQLSTVSYW